MFRPYRPLVAVVAALLVDDRGLESGRDVYGLSCRSRQPFPANPRGASRGSRNGTPRRKQRPSTRLRPIGGRERPLERKRPHSGQGGEAEPTGRRGCTRPRRRRGYDDRDAQPRRAGDSRESGRALSAVDIFAHAPHARTRIFGFSARRASGISHCRTMPRLIRTRRRSPVTWRRSLARAR